MESIDEDDHLCCDTYIYGNVLCADQELHALFPWAGSINISASAVCKGIRVLRGDYVFCSSPTGVLSLGLVRCIVLSRPSQ